MELPADIRKPFGHYEIQELKDGGGNDWISSSWICCSSSLFLFLLISRHSISDYVTPNDRMVMNAGKKLSWLN
jgi:hypothetical protein